MSIATLTIDAFLQASGAILDVRSPGEFAQGHIPSAHSLPLFTDRERACVGTCYKQEGREAAIEMGLGFVGTKLTDFVKVAKQLAPDRLVRVHCWRGGMRSASMGWLLNTAGLEVVLLEGGYKSFRRWVREMLQVPQPIVTLGGMTGTGKTAILQAMAEIGAQVLDLEALASHRGSSYGALGLPNQPSTEHFENLVALEWQALDRSQPVWIEAESRRIGICRVPQEIFAPMLCAPIVEVVRSQEERVAHLLEVYGTTDKDLLITATERIRKRIGGERTKEAVQHIQAGRLADAITIVLAYYDRSYRYDLERRCAPIFPVEVTGLTPLASAQKILSFAQELPFLCSHKAEA